MASYIFGSSGLACSEVLAPMQTRTDARFDRSPQRSREEVGLAAHVRAPWTLFWPRRVHADARSAVRASQRGKVTEKHDRFASLVMLGDAEAVDLERGLGPPIDPRPLANQHGSTP